MNKILKRILIAVLVLALLGGGTFAGLWFLGKRNRKPVNVYDMEQLVMTDYYADETQTYGMVSTTGLQNVYISETQQITEIFVTEGQTVKVGDPVLAFDTTLTDIELEKAKLNLEKLKLQLENTNAELEYVSKLRAVRFDIEDIDRLCPAQSKFIPGNIHDKSVPFQVVFVTENSVIRITPPQIFDLTFISVSYVTEDIFSQRQ